MKRVLSLMLVLAMTVALFAVPAAAVAPEDVTILANTGATITANETGDVKSFTVSYTGCIANKPYILLVVQATLGDSITSASQISGSNYSVSENTILYIWNEVADSTGTVTFTSVYPKAVTNSVFLLGGEFNSPTTSPVILGGVKVAGINVSGTVTLGYDGYYGATAPVAELYDADGKFIKDTPVALNGTTGTYTFTAVPTDATYLVCVKLAGHISTWTNVTIAATDTEKAVSDITLYGGDIDCQFEVNGYDLDIILKNYGIPVSEANDARADIDCQGEINPYDLNAVLNAYSERQAPATEYAASLK